MQFILKLTPDQQIEYACITDELRTLDFDTETCDNRTMAVKATPPGYGKYSGRFIGSEKRPPIAR